MLRRCSTYMNRIVRRALRPPFPSVPFYKRHFSTLQHSAALLAFAHVRPRKVHQRLDMINADDGARTLDWVVGGSRRVRLALRRVHQLCQHVRQVPRAGPNVKHPGRRGGLQEGQQRLAG